MAFVFLARLVFGLALLAQTAASSRTPSSHFDTSRLCAITHIEARAQTVFGGASEQAPQRETGHRHSQCSFCLFGAGDPPLHWRMLSADARRVATSARGPLAYAEGLVLFHIDRNAAARAPPSLS